MKHAVFVSLRNVITCKSHDTTNINSMFL